MKIALSGTHHAFNFKSMEIVISLRYLIASIADFISRVYYIACSLLESVANRGQRVSSGLRSFVADQKESYHESAQTRIFNQFF